MEQICSAAKVNIKQENIIRVNVIGKKHDKPRPTKVIFKYSKTTFQLLTNLSKLQSIKEFEETHVVLDLTEKQNA